jgi:hypothetical protein
MWRAPKKMRLDATWRTSEMPEKPRTPRCIAALDWWFSSKRHDWFYSPNREGTRRLVRNSAKVAALAVLAVYPAQGRDPLGRLQRRRFRHSLPLRQDRPGDAMKLNGAAIGRKLESAQKINTSFSGIYSTFSKSSR